mmetsp:Transcript_19564/g.28138  ORF Transcript_19564/g.28138 Transcript_19564/m.28138 type:complete len:188 (-) Transcript_19564:498-1061(-)
MSPETASLVSGWFRVLGDGSHRVPLKVLLPRLTAARILLTDEDTIRLIHATGKGEDEGITQEELMKALDVSRVRRMSQVFIMPIKAVSRLFKANSQSEDTNSNISYFKSQENRDKTRRGGIDKGCNNRKKSLFSLLFSRQSSVGDENTGGVKKICRVKVYPKKYEKDENEMSLANDMDTLMDSPDSP